MAITVYGRGYPLEIDVISDDVITATLDAGTPIAITNGAVLSATTFSGTNASVTTLTATTSQATNITGTGISGSTLSGTTLSAINAYVGTEAYVGDMSGTVATSAGGTRFAFTSPTAAKLFSGASIGTSGISADLLLEVTAYGRKYYIPCLSAYTKQS